MQLFVTSNHCTSRAHCSTCRDLEGGRPWRRGLTNYFLLPNDNLDFACPHGKDWKDAKPTDIMRAPKPASLQSPPPTLSAMPVPQKATVNNGVKDCGCSRKK